MPTRCITAINRALAKAGVEERLVRNLTGGSYYYIAPPCPVECSIPVYSLAPEDFNFAARCINDAFKQAQLPPPLTLKGTP